MSTPQINYGGPAFPWEDVGNTPNQPTPHSGMTLRDYFAGQALVTLIMQDPKTTHALDNPNGRTWDDWITMNAYGIADAMLKAREVKL